MTTSVMRMRRQTRGILRGVGRPWGTNGLMVLFQVLLVWTVLCVVLLNTDLEKGRADTQADGWVWAAIAIPWLLFLTRYVTLLPNTATQEDRRAYRVTYELWRECFAMAGFALERGKTPDPFDLEVIEEFSAKDTADIAGDRSALERLVTAHKRLSKLVSPAIPKTLVLLSNLDGQSSQARADDDQRRGDVRAGTPERRQDAFSWLGYVRVARMMLGMAVGLLPLFVALALYKGTSLDSGDGLFVGGFQDRAATAIYLMAASALGASFGALFKVRKYVERLNYDDRYESSYWVRFVLGLVAGLVLPVVLSRLLPDGDTQQFRITIPILALVGGFSSDLVYRILKRVIDAVETLIEGDPGEAKAEKHKAEARLRTREAEEAQRLHAMIREDKKNQITLLVSLMSQLPQDAAGAAARDQLAHRLADIASTLTDEKPAAGTASSPA